MLSIAFKTVSAIFAVAAIVTGAQALAQPIRSSQSFGIPIHNDVPQDVRNKRGASKRSKEEKKSSKGSNPELQHHNNVAVFYISLMGVRQLATGVILLTFSVQHKWSEMAQILAIIGFLVAGTDGVYLSKAGRIDLALFHAMPGAGIAALACAALYTGETS